MPRQLRILAFIFQGYFTRTKKVLLGCINKGVNKYGFRKNFLDRDMIGSERLRCRKCLTFRGTKKYKKAHLS